MPINPKLRAWNVLLLLKNYCYCPFLALLLLLLTIAKGLPELLLLKIYCYWQVTCLNYCYCYWLRNYLLISSVWYYFWPYSLSSIYWIVSKNIKSTAFWDNLGELWNSSASPSPLNVPEPRAEQLALKSTRPKSLNKVWILHNKTKNYIK